LVSLVNIHKTIATTTGAIFSYTIHQKPFGGPGPGGGASVLSAIGGLLLKGGEGRGREGTGGEGKKGTGKEGRKGEGRGREVRGEERRGEEWRGGEGRHR